MRGHKQRQPLPLIFLMLLILAVPLRAVAGQDITASWTHNRSKNADTEDTYSLTYSLELEQEITETMALQESFRSSGRWQEEEDNQNIDPSLRFTVNNDIFLLEMYGAASKQYYSDGADQKRSQAELTWASTWDERFWPNLRASYGSNWQEDDLPTPQKDTKNLTDRLDMDWDLEFFKVYYNYSRSDYSDYAKNSQNINTNNFARIEGERSLLANRLNVGFSHQYSETKTTTKNSFSGTGNILIQQPVSQVLHGLDSTPLITAGELTPVAALRDSDLVTASGVATDGIDSPPHNIALKVDFRTIDRIYLYTTVDQSAQSGGFTFDLYTSDNGTNWQLETTAQSFSYDATDHRFVLPINSLTHLWLKVVITTSPLTTIDFSETETYQSVPASAANNITSTSSSSITDFNLGYLITDSLSLTYNLSMEDGEYSSGIDYDRYNQAGSLQWRPYQSFTTSLGINETTSQNGDSDESKIRSYTLNMDSTPIDTLSMNLGFGRTENYLGSERLSVNYNAGLLTTAAIYPDLDASLTLNYGHATEDSTNITIEDYNASLTLTARLVPSLTTDLTTNYQEVLGSDGINSTDTTLNINWRTSEMLSLHVAGKKNWVDSESESEGVTTSITLAPTDTTQFSLTYIYADSTERLNRYTVFGSWSIGPHFTMQGNGSYTESGDEEEWLIQSQLVARFSIL